MIFTAAACLLSASAHSQHEKPKQAVAAAAAASKLPRLIMIARHGEKSGDERDPDLTPTGRDRAMRLPALFAATAAGPARFPRPDFLFATAASKKSNRPAETIAPLAAALHQPVNLNFGKDDARALARELLDGRYAGKVVLIVWHHHAIPGLAHDLGVGEPPHWSDETFDRVWEIAYPDGTAHLTSLPEGLLPGDSQ